METDYTLINKKIANQLKIPYEVVKYIRPRLLSEYYNGSLEKLKSRTEDHLQNSKQNTASAEKSVLQRQGWAKKYPQTATTHLKKIEATRFMIDHSHKTQQLYEAVLLVLYSMTQKELAIVLQE